MKHCKRVLCVVTKYICFGSACRSIVLGCGHVFILHPNCLEVFSDVPGGQS